MDTQTVRERYQRISSHLDEKSRRLWCANESVAIGFGGVSLVSQATGVSRTTIIEGKKEITGGKDVPKDGVRRKGGGRKRKTDTDKTLTQSVEKLVDAETRGDPESPLKWTSKSTRKIADVLNKTRMRASHTLVSRILSSLGFSLQANRKTNEGAKNNPDRDAQFQFINTKTKDFQKHACPVISVDTKKKENIGNFKNNGKEYHKKGKPKEVNVYDFIDTIKGKVAPYGVYDLTKNNGWVSVGISSDTAAFAVNSIRTWWRTMGSQEYQDAREILITADCGGSNGYRVRLWKTELQALATELRMSIHVSHFPPGTSKWNKIEHRLFSFITKNWRGKPLIDRATVVQLIGNTTTSSGLTVRAELDERYYEKGITVPNDVLAAVKLERAVFHGEWNYKILP
jgi:transposase